jgi:hypothetical protein
VVFLNNHVFSFFDRANFSDMSSILEQDVNYRLSNYLHGVMSLRTQTFITVSTKIPTLAPILSQMNVVHTTPSSFPKIHFITVRSKPT